MTILKQIVSMFNQVRQRKTVSFRGSIFQFGKGHKSPRETINDKHEPVVNYLIPPIVGNEVLHISRFYKESI